MTATAERAAAAVTVPTAAMTTVPALARWGSCEQFRHLRVYPGPLSMRQQLGARNPLKPGVLPLCRPGQPPPSSGGRPSRAPRSNNEQLLRAPKAEACARSRFTNTVTQTDNNHGDTRPTSAQRCSGTPA